MPSKIKKAKKANKPEVFDLSVLVGVESITLTTKKAFVLMHVAGNSVKVETARASGKRLLDVLATDQVKPATNT